MSFEDFGSSTSWNSIAGAKADVAAGIFQTATAVAGFRRLVDAIGSAKDSPKHRHTLQEARKWIAQLVKDTSSKLKVFSDANVDAQLINRTDEEKLAKDFQKVLLDFQKVQKLAVQKEAAYAMATSLSSDEHKTHDTNEEHEQLLQEQKRQEEISLDCEITFNEALIEEREQGIKDVHSDVVEINEILKDLVFLIDNQQPTLEDIGIRIEAAAAASTTQAREQLAMGYKGNRSNTSSYCWVLMLFVVVLATLLMVLILY
ncbi:syntaxin-22-like isoform X1 [Dioscorea cayenensis subsp. rotundata]|uniref:Syntaxin-22-like isoform X1 n=1 Tax=Dioscorea cayennensis subsp. rotundata TaxID=55577 RepID=A0AB40D4T1_DIOCR|nr:syntaxin-22-like isoform X1 [Dioscorea cayenensis subsp. rotundata]